MRAFIRVDTGLASLSNFKELVDEAAQGIEALLPGGIDRWEWYVQTWYAGYSGHGEMIPVEEYDQRTPIRNLVLMGVRYDHADPRPGRHPGRVRDELGTGNHARPQQGAAGPVR